MCIACLVSLCLCGLYDVGVGPVKGRSFLQVTLAYANKYVLEILTAEDSGRH